jgi:chromosome segregation ATPase
MYIALGFVAATLIALLIIPAINARAERLARRRAEALFPMSISELTAEKDHLRAEFAVQQRRIERKAEEALAIKHQTMEELGRRAMRIDALETDLAEREAIIASLHEDLAEARSRLAATEDELGGTRASLAGTRDTLSAVEDAHRKSLDELGAVRAELERTNTMLAGTKAELLLATDRLGTRETGFEDLDERHAAALNELDTKRIRISDLETRLATQTSRAHDFERALDERKRELAEERQRLSDLARNLLAEQERSLVFEQRILELENERDNRAVEQAPSEAPAGAALAGLDRLRAPERIDGQDSQTSATEVHSVLEQVDALRAERSALEAALSVAHEERARLEKELRMLRRSGGATNDEIRAENAELRQRIVEVAEQVMGSSARDGKTGKNRRKAG